MNVEYLITGLIGAAVMVYLAYALIKPEDF
jgi:K+-transporting ATPase KdpF subunit